MDVLQDASQMSSMHEAAFLNLLRRRYRSDKIYTWTADILISVNPYKDIPLLYDMPIHSIRSQEVSLFCCDIAVCVRTVGWSLAPITLR